MVQGLPDKDLAVDVVWVEVRAKVKAEWAARLQQDRTEIVCVRNAEQLSLMLPDSHVIQETVLNAALK